VTVAPNYYEAGRPDVAYTWTFTLTNNVPVNGKIVLTFPEQNYVLSVTPTPTCTFSGGLADESASEKLKCTSGATKITIENFAEV
jgi:hypothetical protein